MSALKDLVVRLRADASEYTKGTQQAQKDNEKLKDSTEKTGKSISGGFMASAKSAMGFAAGIASAVGVAAGITSITGYLEGAVQGAMDMQVAQNETNRILSSGSHIIGITAGQVDNLSQQLSMSTGVDDDVVRGAENIIAGYSQISANAFPGVTKAALDMARYLSNTTGKTFDTAAAAQALGTALQDPAKGARLLRAQNIVLSQSEQDAINAATKHGDTLKAQGLLLADVQKRVNGSSDAYKNSAAGGMMAFQTAMGNIQKTIGTAILPILTQLLAKVTPLAQQFAANLPGAITSVQGALKNLQPPFQWLTDHVDMGKVVMGVLAAGFVVWAVSAASAAVATIAATWPILAVIAGIALLVVGIKLLIDHWGAISTFFGNVAGAIGGFFGNLFGAIGNFFGAIIGFVGNLAKKYFELITWPYRTAWDWIRNILSVIGAFLVAAWAAIVTNVGKALGKIGEIIGGIVKFFQDLPGKVWTAVSTFTVGLLTRIGQLELDGLRKIGEFIGGIVAFFQGLPGKVWTFVSSLATGILTRVGDLELNALNKVRDLISGIVSNFQSLPGKAMTALENLKSAALGKINDLKSMFQNGLNDIRNFFTGLILKLPHINLPHFSITGSLSINPPSVPHLDIQWYRTGGIFTGPQVIGVGEAGPEAVIPLDRLSSAGGGGSDDRAINVTLMIDGRQLARILLPHQVDEIRRSAGIRAI